VVEKYVGAAVVARAASTMVGAKTLPEGTR
jgi:hypothetical protein